MCTLVLLPRMRSRAVVRADDVGGNAATYGGIHGEATDEGLKSRVKFKKVLVAMS